MRPVALLAVLGCLGYASGASSQTLLERSPNIQGVWGVQQGHGTFVLAHRFEVLRGGDKLFSVPTLTLAVGLPLGVAAGVDFTSFSEVIPGRVSGNEAQYWLKKPLRFDALETAVLGGYNSAAKSAEGALDLRLAAGRFDVYVEARGHSNLFGLGDAGASGTLGAAFRLNRHLAITGDFGRVLTEDSIPGAWSAALAFEIPGSPHTLALQLGNSGATTLQGVSRRKTIGAKDIRHGFTFTVPLGNPARWARILRPLPIPPAAAGGVRQVELLATTIGPAELRLLPGESVRWRNLEGTSHTLVADDGSWRSGRLERGDSFTRAFQPGRHHYHCLSHPEMRAAIVVGS